MIKRLETAQEMKRKEKRRQYALGIVLIVVLFGSVFGIIVNTFNSSSSDNPNQKLNYNGHVFEVFNGYYNTSIGNNVFYFSNSPNETDLVPVLTNFSRKISSYSGKEVYISSKSYPVYAELAQNLNSFALRVQGACKSGEYCADKTLPLKTCSDNLIIVKNSTINKIYEDNNCIYIEGNETDLLKLTDEFLLRELGIK